MLSDYFTKPLQGAPFREFRDCIMNVDPNKKRNADPRSVLGNAKKCTTGISVRPEINGTDMERAALLVPVIETTGGYSGRDRTGTVLTNVGMEWEVVKRRKVRCSTKVQVHLIN